MMDDEREFIKAATAEPDEDTLRLAYADWLDERGDAVSASQAAFVRLQVRRSRLDVFDPDRAGLLEQEALALQKHKRDWNGRVHRQLHRAKLFGLVDSRRGLIRGWEYHRGMAARIALEAQGLATRPAFVFSLGPVQALDLFGWCHWSASEQSAVDRHFANVKLVTLRGAALPLQSLARFQPLRRAEILDLRCVSDTAQHLSALAHSALIGDLPPVVLFHAAVQTSTPYTYAGHQYTRVTSSYGDYMIDPFNRWDELRLWYADLTGKVLSPIRYQAATR
jgi:uncharacterized protein (TIGR02996 family)